MLLTFSVINPAVSHANAHVAAHTSCASLTHLTCVSDQGRHVKTGQLAAIKVMDVTEVSAHNSQSHASNISLLNKTNEDIINCII